MHGAKNGETNQETDLLRNLEACEMVAIQLQCQRCGDCCRILGHPGVEVTKAEWEALEEAVYSLKLDLGTIERAKQILCLPTKGKRGIRGCAFLTDTKECLVYDKRPKVCREFPIWITETPTRVVLEVSLLCPRARGLATVLQNDPPEWIRILIGAREHSVVLV